jgi:hypothetical protein
MAAAARTSTFPLLFGNPILHKLRCALTSNVAMAQLNGIVEMDGGWFGGRKTNTIRDPRPAMAQRVISLAP